jgi:hypothetical protein
LLVNALLNYTDFFFVIERGLSRRVMVKIFRAPQKKLTPPQLQRLYPYDYILQKRLGQCVKMGYVRREGGTLRSTGARDEAGAVGAAAAAHF